MVVTLSCCGTFALPTVTHLSYYGEQGVDDALLADTIP